MSSEDLDCLIAERLKAGDAQNKIKKELHVGDERIRNVRDMVASGMIKFNEEDKAYLAQPAQKQIEEIHAEVMKVISVKASEMAVRNAEEDYALGNEIRQYWTLKAQEAGLSLREFVRSALIFYDTYREKVEAMEEQLALMEVLKDTVRTDLLRTHKMDLFYRFTRYCISLRVQGFQLPEAILNDFYHDLNTLEVTLKKGKTVAELMGGNREWENSK